MIGHIAGYTQAARHQAHQLAACGDLLIRGDVRIAAEAGKKRIQPGAQPIFNQAIRTRGDLCRSQYRRGIKNAVGHDLSMTIEHHLARAV
ncbi:hypothetical protein GGR39_001994 [Novosphingobium fluoreni]|uniref:Uncharacterized protein n=1 Tax=Novosphingobium fluoreni TaxID=1391222 RepID=A0A7W6FZN5_9SPHN|nr:hypothetical protein [Novosphingobium fluoreni]MBB3940337.1 hypothetical protein [Novosphingobium fluoreni]